MDLIGRSGIGLFPVFYINPFSYRYHSSRGCWQLQTVTNHRTTSIVSRANNNNKKIRGHYCRGSRGVRGRPDIVIIGRGRSVVVPRNNLIRKPGLVKDFIVSTQSTPSSTSLSSVADKTICGDNSLPTVRISPPPQLENKRTTTRKNNFNNNSHNNKTEINENKPIDLHFETSETRNSVSFRNLKFDLSSAATETNRGPFFKDNSDLDSRKDIICGRSNSSSFDNTSVITNEYSVSSSTAARPHILSLIKEERSFDEEDDNKITKPQHNSNSIIKTQDNNSVTNNQNQSTVQRDDLICEQKKNNASLDFWFDNTSSKTDDQTIKAADTQMRTLKDGFCFESMYFQLTSNQMSNDGGVVSWNKDTDIIKPVFNKNESEIVIKNENNEVRIKDEEVNIVNKRCTTQKGNGILPPSYSVISERSSEVEIKDSPTIRQVEIEEEEKPSLEFSDSCDADDESSVHKTFNIRPAPVGHHRPVNKNHSVVESKHHHNHHYHHHHRNRKISRHPSMDCPVLLEDIMLPTSESNNGAGLIGDNFHKGVAANPKMMAIPVPLATADKLSRSCSCPQDVNTIYKRLSDVGLHHLPRVKHSLEGTSMFRRQGSDRRSKRRAADHHRQRKKGISTMEMSTLDLLTVFEAASRNTPSRLSLRMKDNPEVCLLLTNLMLMISLILNHVIK